MKALSKTNRNLHDKFKIELANDKAASDKLKLEGERLIKSEETKTEGETMIAKSKEIAELSNSTKEKFFQKHSSAGSKDYQKRIELV